MKETEKAYLAGLWDGEGSITVWKTERSKGVPKIIPCITLTNTNEDMILYAERLLHSVGVKYFKHSYDRKNAKRIHQLTCRNLESVKKFLESVTPYLVAKKKQAQMTLQFVSGRLDTLLYKPRGWNTHAPYSQEELAISDEIMALNKKGAVKEKVQRL